MIGSFDRLGFTRHQRRYRPTDLEVDLIGRICLVSGANAGLGRSTARGLASRGATVHLLCRDRERGEVARDELRRETGSARIELDVVDVSDLGSIRRFIEHLDVPHVDVLVHNAGVLPGQRVVTSDGLELCFATHVAGPHLLTRLLVPRLGDDARVIFVSSGGMYTQRLDLDDLNRDREPYDGVVAYAQTKRMQVILAERWSRRLAETGVSVFSMHPGWADTRSVELSLPRFHRWLRPVLRSPEQGADTIVWLAACSPAPSPSGAFWFDRAPRSAHYLPWTRESAATRDALWTTVERVTAST